jgi:hypothetical protein
MLMSSCMLGMCYILCPSSSVCVASDAQGGLGAVPQRIFFASGNVSYFFLIFPIASIFVSIVGRFFDTWFFADGFLFLVKELGLLTNPGHWVRVLDADGSYMYIVL